MSTAVTEFVMNHPLFSHHDHHRSFLKFEEDKNDFYFGDLLGYAKSGLKSAAGPRAVDVPEKGPGPESWIRANWPAIRSTGYGRAVDLTSRELFGLEYAPENFAAINDEMRSLINSKSIADLYDYCVCEKAANKWVIQDNLYRTGKEDLIHAGVFPAYYRHVWRFDDLLSIHDDGPIKLLEKSTGVEILSLDDLVKAMNANIDVFQAGGLLAAIKIGIAYKRDLVIRDATRHEAELAFTQIRNRKSLYGGIQQNAAAVNLHEARPLGDYMFHALVRRANDEDLPVQIHTGYLAGVWGALGGTKAMNLVPVFEKYRRVRFDIFHASWPWTSELGAIAKNYPNVYPDMCWAWAMNPAESERTLSEWLDGVPYNKIFGYGADTTLPWCNIGYSTQARIGIARVLEHKIAAGFFSQSTARDVATAIMLKNGERFFRLGS